MKKDNEYQFTVYTRQIDDGWEGFAAEQHSGTFIYTGKTEEQLLDDIRKDFAEIIVYCMSIGSFFDFDENKKHEYPINYRLAEKQDIRGFKQVNLVIPEDDISSYRKDFVKHRT